MGQMSEYKSQHPPKNRLAGNQNGLQFQPGELRMTYTIPFIHLSKNDLLTAGGKGANLGELTKAGFPVPPGFVLTTAAYDDFVKENGLQAQIIDLASQVSANEPKSSEEASTAINNLFLAGKMPQAVQVDLLSVYAELVVEGGSALAVRSSATAEDLPDASFAGQQDTYLNIQGEKALFEAVKKCWASLWTARAIAYRLRQNIDPATVSLAVVLQELIPAESAGILFTANPVDGQRDQVVINATWGLGEAIVGGQVTPDSVIVDKSNWEIIARQTVAKTLMTTWIEQGTAAQPVPHAQQTQSVLDDAMALELTQMGIQIEAHYGMPMDIEWAVSGEEIAILQARPITNLPPAPLKDVRWDPPRPGTIWMRRQVVEHMPEPLSSLFDELYLEEGLDQSMESLTVFMSDLSGIEIKLWDFIDPPFAASVNGYAYSIASFNFSPKMVPMALQIYITVLPKMIKHLMPHWENEALPNYLAKIEEWKYIELTQASDKELLRGIRELAHQDAIYWFAAAVPLGLARTSDAVFDRFLKSVFNGERLTSGAFLRGFPSKTAQAQAQLEAIARKINRIAGLREQISSTTADALPNILVEYPEIMSAFQEYLDLYGHQIYNLDFAAPTLADDPLPVLMSLQTAVAHPERDVRLQQAELAEERDRLAARAARSINPILRPIYWKLLGWAQRYSPNREVALFFVGAAWPALRRLAHELGERLTEAGCLHHPEDIYYLKSVEIAQASAARIQGINRTDFAELAKKRRILRQARMQLDPPVAVPPDGRMKFGPIDMGMFEPKPRSVSSGPILDGFAVSPGMITAPASIIRSPDDFDKMTPDTILVCKTTTPAWTPLFAQARGLVTDIGGALAHGSIVAREYGIPAVMGTGAATQRIQDGEIIQVDGDRGTVTLVDQIDPREEAKIQAQRAAEVQAAARKRKAMLVLFIGTVLGLIWCRRRR
jgi:phosphohistidine swiveling domain-containing protein